MLRLSPNSPEVSTGLLVSSVVPFNQQINLACTAKVARYRCTLSPTQVNLIAAPVPIVLTLSAEAASPPPPRKGPPLYPLSQTFLSPGVRQSALFLLGFGVIFFLAVRTQGMALRLTEVCRLAIFLLALCLSGCGVANFLPSPPTVTVTAQS